ncbi:S1 RNA-binding domain-containing protein 1-like [Diadema setosum]|uniref:S1 RNA-binding domain-containing protein 1-like n=1 Tax=Diadema setosum TaxID=31175 RepID=UPI003B3A3860
MARPKSTPVEDDWYDDNEDMHELSFYEGPPWHPPKVIQDQLNESGIRSNNLPLELGAVENVVKLLEDECTVPFIARYRKELTMNMEPKVIQEIKSSLEELKVVQEKTKSHLDQLARQKRLTLQLRESFCGAQSLLELEQLFAPFKTGSKTTLAERARRAGLEPAAEALLDPTQVFDVQNYIKPDGEGCQSAEEVEKGVQHVIADMVAKDKTCMDHLRESKQFVSRKIYLLISKASQSRKKNKPAKMVDYDKFKMYITNQKFYIDSIKPHQVLAINRGEEQSALTVKVILPDEMTTRFLHWCTAKWSREATPDSYTKKCIRLAVEDAYNRLMLPMLIREIRSKLNKWAVKASVEVFGRNLHRLLLTPPIKNCTILGLDPGYKNGCKMAVISPTGDILHTDISYMHTGNKFREKEKLIDVIKSHGCNTVAIGNGTASRETEVFISNLILSQALRHNNIMYCIVNEDGSSIYSVSAEAEKEMPHLDPNVRSAVSIARRLQDPLAELVKIEPKHIGVGMYQHDVPEKQLKEALDDVVELCVSFVGVDINVCSESLLRRVAGISVAMAKKIIAHRKKIGLFTNRQQLLEIKGLGPKTFKQCAGFIRILQSAPGEGPSQDLATDSQDEVEDIKPSKRKRNMKSASRPAKRKKTSPESSDDADLLDSTWIHPESYKRAGDLMELASASRKEIGTGTMKEKLDNMIQSHGKSSLARMIGIGEPTLQLIIDGLSQPANKDIRAEYAKPVFKRSVMSIDDIKPGVVVTGVVKNAVPFGVFVDIGVGTNGLCHKTKMSHTVLNGHTLGPGDKVDVVVLSKTDTSGGKVNISLRLVSIKL